MSVTCLLLIHQTGQSVIHTVFNFPLQFSSAQVRCKPVFLVCFSQCSFSLQVNSDVVFHSRSKDGTMEPVKVNRTHVGRMVLTKAPGDVTRLDITDQYKFPEGQPSQLNCV